MADGSDGSKAPVSQTPPAVVTTPAAPKKRKALSLDIKDLSEVVERKISPAA